MHEGRRGPPCALPYLRKRRRKGDLVARALARPTRFLSWMSICAWAGSMAHLRNGRISRGVSGPIKLKKRVAPSSVANNVYLVLLRDRRSFPRAQKSLVPQLTPSVSCLGCPAVCLHTIPLANVIVLKDRLPYMVYAHGGLSHRAPRPQQVVPVSSAGQSPRAGWVPEPCDRLGSNSVPPLITRCTLP